MNHKMDNNHNFKQFDCIEGIIKKGFGKGSYFVKIYASKLEKVYQFKPYFGTLNLSISLKDQKKLLSLFTDKNNSLLHKIPPYTKNGKKFGELDCLVVSIMYNNKILKAGIIRPYKTTHPLKIIEVIAPKRICDDQLIKINSKVTLLIKKML